MATTSTISPERERIKQTTRENVDLIMEQRSSENPASVIFLVGRSGVGKSSLVEHATDTTGYSDDTLGPFTIECELVKKIIDEIEYFFIDTPGLDDIQSGEHAISQIGLLLYKLLPHIKVVGVWYVVDNERNRDIAIDTVIFELVRELCGEAFFPYITFVTTHWGCEALLPDLEKRLERRKEQWMTCLQKGAKLYQHGYENSIETNHIIQWSESSRPLLRRQIKNMITRHCGKPPSVEPRIIEELRRKVDLVDTAAWKVLLLNKIPSPGFNRTSSDRSNKSPQSTEGLDDDEPSTPRTEAHRPSMDQRPSDEQSQPREPRFSHTSESAESTTGRASRDSQQRQTMKTSFWDNWRFHIGFDGITIDYVGSGIPRGSISVTPSDIISGVSVFRQHSSRIAAQRGEDTSIATATTAATGVGSSNIAAPAESVYESHGLAGLVGRMFGPPAWMGDRDLNDPYVQNMMKLDSFVMASGVVD